MPKEPLLGLFDDKRVAEIEKMRALMDAPLTSPEEEEAQRPVHA